VAQFPLPIITGIGHDRDESILDMVSHTRVKTPTAAAAFLIDQLQAVMERIETAEQRITHQAQVQLSLLHSQLSILSERIPTLFSLVRTRHEARINQLSTRLSAQLSARLGREQHQLEKLGAQLSALTERRLLTERHRLEMLEQRVASLDPQLLLKRGYSITLYKGKAVRNTTELKTGDKIETRLSEGTIKSIVT
jgi:exodeoxyribonuclease VII large subunit